MTQAISKKLPATHTPIQEKAFYKALKNECPTMSDVGICVLMAHWALETGRGKKCIAYNIGNIKATSAKSGDYCYFITYERLPTASAEKMCQASSASAPAKIITHFTSGYDLVRLEPEHPGCRFLAYETLTEGVSDYVKYLKLRFSSCWPDIESGDVVSFSRHLKECGYFTAPETVYTKALKSLFSGYLKIFVHKDQNGISSSESKLLVALPSPPGEP